MTAVVRGGSYQPTSAADSFDLILGGADPRVVIGDFLDDWRRSPRAGRESMVVTPIADAIDDSSERWAAYFAAMVDQLAYQEQLSRPKWVTKTAYVLDRPWFLVPAWSLRAWQLTQTPVAFRLRNIFGGDDLLKRV